jgi:hypothetical protein
MIARPCRIGVRLSEEEHRKIREQADASLLSVSEFIRRRAFGKQIVPQSDLRVLAELRRLGGLLKHIHLETRGAYSALTANAIRALESYARTMKRNRGENPLEKGLKNAGCDSGDRQSSPETQGREEQFS